MVSSFVSHMTMQTLDSAGIALGSYAAVDTAGIEGALAFFRINNDSDTDIFLSFDNSNDNYFIKAADKLDLPLQANSSPTNMNCKQKKNSIVYIRGTAGTGNIYISGFYQN